MQAVGEDGQWENTALEGFERYGLIYVNNPGSP
jgi:hypothetical protein